MRYFIIAASRDHVLLGVQGGFAQAGHGRRTQLDRLAKGDKIIYYSAKQVFAKSITCQAFTAIGTVTDDEPYQETPTGDLKNFRRKVHYDQCRETPIRPLLEKLHFIKDKAHWGLALMPGFMAITEHDYNTIAHEMLP